MCVVALLYLAHYLIFCVVQPFYIEDAGISFAYAKNFVDGEGFVTYPGGERVEGFSNPLWTFLIGVFYFVGVSPWTSCKILGAIFGLITLPCIYKITRRMGVNGDFALFAPAMLAISPQFVIWNASGLENSLYVMLLASGSLRLLIEVEKPSRLPWSGLLFCGVAMTRPEGLMYVVVAGAGRLLFAGFDKQQWKALVKWGFIFLVPFVIYFYWRMSYFSWTYPNTYYAKLGKGDRFLPFNWETRGWGYISNYFGMEYNDKQKRDLGHAVGYFLPLLPIGLVGLRRTRALLLGFLVVPLAVILLWDGKDADAGWRAFLWANRPFEENWAYVQVFWVPTRVVLILAVATLAGILILPKRRAQLLLSAVFFGLAVIAIYQIRDYFGVEEKLSEKSILLAEAELPSQKSRINNEISNLKVEKYTHLYWFVCAIIFCLYTLFVFFISQVQRLAKETQESMSSRTFQQAWHAKSLFWAMGCSSLFFVLYSGGDWMKEFRWFNVVEIFLFPFLVLGLWVLLRTGASVLHSLQTAFFPTKEKHFRLAGIGLSTTGVLAIFVMFCKVEVENTMELVADPETSVSDINRRVRYMQWVQRRLDIDHVTLLDVDMGAHLYYSGFDIVDIAGLVDVPMAQHSNYDMKFIREYIFTERNPEFAHVHGGWARTSKIPRHKEWEKRYLEIPGYPVGKRTLHIGNHIRKDLLFQTIKDEEFPNKIELQGQLELLSHEVPSPIIPVAGESKSTLLYVYTAWRGVERTSDVQVLFAFIDENGEVAATSSVQPGFRWYNAEHWEEDEKIEGKFRVPVDLPEGKYRLFMAVLEHNTGAILGPSRSSSAEVESVSVDAAETLLAEDKTSVEPPASEKVLSPNLAHLFVQGEIDLQTTITVVSTKEAVEQALLRKEQALEQAEGGDCVSSWTTWKNATRHLLRNTKWRKHYEGAVKTAIAQCYVSKAKAADSRVEKIDFLIQSRFWDHKLEEMLEESIPLAEDLDKEGQADAAEARTFSTQQFLDTAFAKLSVSKDPKKVYKRSKAKKEVNNTATSLWESAYDKFYLAMQLDPSRSWTRNRAEEARDKKLHIKRPYQVESKKRNKMRQDLLKVIVARNKLKTSKSKSDKSKANKLKTNMPQKSTLKNNKGGLFKK